MYWLSPPANIPQMLSKISNTSQDAPASVGGNRWLFMYLLTQSFGSLWNDAKWRVITTWVLSHLPILYRNWFADSTDCPWLKINCPAESVPWDKQARPATRAQQHAVECTETSPLICDYITGTTSGAHLVVMEAAGGWGRMLWCSRGTQWGKEKLP